MQNDEVEEDSSETEVEDDETDDDSNVVGDANLAARSDNSSDSETFNSDSEFSSPVLKGIT